MLFSDFTSNFFWDFKRMDNVDYNFEIVEILYAAKKQNNNDKHFNKPILILLMAIIECTLYDFILRINQHRSDSFPNITWRAISYFRDAGSTDVLKRLIPQIKSQNLMRVSENDSLYDDLEYLRKVRNRIHIQNKYNLLGRNEYGVFSDPTLEKAQGCLEKIYDALCNVYPRWQNQPISMSDFPRPWL